MTRTVELAEKWFRLDPLADGVTRIIEPEIDPFIQCNIWHVRGRDRDLLIDTGMGVRPLRAEIPLLTEKPIICLSTHCHFDHWGSLHEFDERLGHALEAEVYAAPTNRTTLADIFVSDDSFKRLPETGFQAKKYHVKAAPLTRYVDEGDLIDLGDRILCVLHLPGHTPGQIGVWEEKTGLLFSGDALYDGPLFDNWYEAGPAEYVETMHRLRELPVNTVHGGHNLSFGRARMIELVDEYLSGQSQRQSPA